MAADQSSELPQDETANTVDSYLRKRSVSSSVINDAEDLLRTQKRDLSQEQIDTGDPKTKEEIKALARKQKSVTFLIKEYLARKGIESENFGVKNGVAGVGIEDLPNSLTRIYSNIEDIYGGVTGSGKVKVEIGQFTNGGEFQKIVNTLGVDTQRYLFVNMYLDEATREQMEELLRNKQASHFTAGTTFYIGDDGNIGKVVHVPKQLNDPREPIWKDPRVGDESPYNMVSSPVTVSDLDIIKKTIPLLQNRMQTISQSV